MLIKNIFKSVNTNRNTAHSVLVRVSLLVVAAVLVYKCAVAGAAAV